MDKVEIVSSYRQAKQKAKQIGILAELNACSKDEIKEILMEAGEFLPYQRKEAPSDTKRDKAPEDAGASEKKTLPGAIVWHKGTEKPCDSGTFLCVLLEPDGKGGAEKTAECVGYNSQAGWIIDSAIVAAWAEIELPKVVL